MWVLQKTACSAGLFWLLELSKQPPNIEQPEQTKSVKSKDESAVDMITDVVCLKPKQSSILLKQ